jgi:ABC-2 type transport system ATP-binding protein
VAIALSDGTPPEDLLTALGALNGVERVERVEAAHAGPAAFAGGWPGANGPPGMPPSGPPRPEGIGGPRELRARLYVSGDAPLMVAPVARLLADRKAELTDVTIGTPSLEDVFIHLTGRALR